MQSKGRNWQPVKFIEKPHEHDQGHVPGFYSSLRRLIGDVIIMTLPLGILVYVGCSVFIGCNQSCCPHWQLPLRQPLAAAYGRAMCSQATLSYTSCIPNCESADGTYTVKWRENASFWPRSQTNVVLFLCGFDQCFSLDCIVYILSSVHQNPKMLLITKAGRLATCLSLILLQPLVQMNHSII